MSKAQEKLLSAACLAALLVTSYFIVVEHGWLLLVVVGALFLLLFVLQSELQRQSALIDVQRQQIQALQSSAENLSLSLMEIRNRLAQHDFEDD